MSKLFTKSRIGNMTVKNGIFLGPMSARGETDRGLRVNAIAPGLIMTDMVRGVNQDELKISAARIPLGRIGDTSDIAGCVEYIVNAPYLTGQTISPNGGFVMH